MAKQKGLIQTNNYIENYWYRLLISLDQLVNVILGGDEDVCLSSRAYIQSREGKPRRAFWERVRRCINGIFFWQVDHCKGSYLWEVRKKKQWLNDNKGL